MQGTRGEVVHWIFLEMRIFGGLVENNLQRAIQYQNFKFRGMGIFVGKWALKVTFLQK